MLGERGIEQPALFCEFSFDRHVPQDHLLRAIDRFVALDGVGVIWRRFTARSAGHPSRGFSQKSTVAARAVANRKTVGRPSWRLGPAASPSLAF